MVNFQEKINENIQGFKLICTRTEKVTTKTCNCKYHLENLQMDLKKLKKFKKNAIQKNITLGK